MEKNIILTKLQSICNSFIITSAGLLAGLPINVLAEETDKAEEDVASLTEFYNAVHDGVGHSLLVSENGKSYVTNLNNLYNWGMDVIRYGYYFAFAVAVIALVASIIRMIINSDNPESITQCRKGIMVSLISIATLGSIGVVFYLILFFLSL